MALRTGRDRDAHQEVRSSRRLSAGDWSLWILLAMLTLPWLMCGGFAILDRATGRDDATVVLSNRGAEGCDLEVTAGGSRSQVSIPAGEFREVRVHPWVPIQVRSTNMPEMPVGNHRELEPRSSVTALVKPAGLRWRQVQPGADPSD